MGPPQLTLLTFNTLGIPFLTTHQHKNYFRISQSLLARFTYLAAQLNTSDADVILLQEVHLYSLLRYLKRKLINYPYVSYKRFLYGPRSGLVIFSKHELDEHPYLNYTHRGTFKDKSFTTKIVRNGALIVTLKNTKLTLFNTYITGDFSHKWGEENKYTPLQRDQLQELASAAQEILKTGRDCIIAGDMNINTGSPLYAEFISSLPLTDFFKNALTYTHHPDFLPVWATSPRLDHIFMTTNYHLITDVTTQELFTEKVHLPNGKESFLSDHIALKATIAYKKKE